MALLQNQGPRSDLKHHLEVLSKRLKLVENHDKWPAIDKFAEEHPSLVSSLLASLDSSKNLGDFYSHLRKAEKCLGNALQQRWSRKQAREMFETNLNSPSFSTSLIPCPDPQLSFFIKVVFESIFTSYNKLLAEALDLAKPRKVVPLMLNAYLNELHIIETTGADIKGSTQTKKQKEAHEKVKAILIGYLNQWAGNQWPPAMRASDITAKSWATAIMKMKQLFELEWKPAPLVEVFDDSAGKSILIPDDSKTLESFTSIRAFFLSLFFYCIIDPNFLLLNFKSTMENVKNSVQKELLGDLLQQYVDKKTQELKALNIQGEGDKILQTVNLNCCHNPKCSSAEDTEKESPQLQFCSACMAVKYCSTSCQTEDWNRHKTACQQIVYRNMVKTGDGN